MGYSEYTSICDDLIVLSVYGTAAVIKHLDPQHTTTEGTGKENHGENSRSQILVQIVFLRSHPQVTLTISDICDTLELSGKLSGNVRFFFLESFREMIMSNFNLVFLIFV